MAVGTVGAGREKMSVEVSQYVVVLYMSDWTIFVHPRTLVSLSALKPQGFFFCCPGAYSAADLAPVCFFICPGAFGFARFITQAVAIRIMSRNTVVLRVMLFMEVALVET